MKLMIGNREFDTQQFFELFKKEGWGGRIGMLVDTLLGNLDYYITWRIEDFVRCWRRAAYMLMRDLFHLILVVISVIMAVRFICAFGPWGLVPWAAVWAGVIYSLLRLAWGNNPVYPSPFFSQVTFWGEWVNGWFKPTGDFFLYGPFPWRTKNILVSARTEDTDFEGEPVRCSVWRKGRRLASPGTRGATETVAAALAKHVKILWVRDRENAVPFLKLGSKERVDDALENAIEQWLRIFATGKSIDQVYGTRGKMSDRLEDYLTQDKVEYHKLDASGEVERDSDGNPILTDDSSQGKRVVVPAPAKLVGIKIKQVTITIRLSETYAKTAERMALEMLEIALEDRHTRTKVSNAWIVASQSKGTVSFQEAIEREYSYDAVDRDHGVAEPARAEAARQIAGAIKSSTGDIAAIITGLGGALGKGKSSKPTGKGYHGKTSKKPHTPRK